MTSKENICKNLEEFLASPKSYTELDFSDDEIQIGNEGAIALANVLKNELTEIDLRIHISTDIDRDKALINALNTARWMAYSNGDATTNVEDAQVVVRFHKNPLRHINLRNNQIGDEGAAALAESLKGKKTLVESLDLSGNQIGKKGAAALAESLKGNNKLKYFYLNSNQIGDEGAAALIESLKDSNTLDILGLDNNRIGDEGAAALIKSLKGNKTLVKNLYLNSNQIGDEGAAALIESLKGNKTLVKNLYLGSNQIGDKGAAVWAESLKNNKILLHGLDLGDNQIGDEGAAALAESLKDNNTLHELNLGFNQIGDKGATDLAESLKDSDTLHKLNLSFNQIGDKGAAALAESLKDNNTLHELNLENNLMGDEGAASLTAFTESTTRNKKIFDSVKNAFDVISSSNTPDVSKPEIKAFNLKYYQSSKNIIHDFKSTIEYNKNKIEDHIHDNFFHLTAVCKDNPLVGDDVDGSVLPKFLWNDIFGYLKLSDVKLNATESEESIALSGDDGPV